MEVHNALSVSLQTGFLDHLLESDKFYRPELLTNNKEQEKKVLTTILRKLENCDQFWFSVAFVTTSGIATLMNTLIELEKKKIKGKILASQYLNFTQPEALERILKFSNIELRIATSGDFHSKGYLFQKGAIYDLIIGSSNLTQSALSTNTELNLKVSATFQSELIRKSLEEFTREFNSAEAVTENFLEGYKQIYLEQKQLTLKIKNNLERKEIKIVPNSMQEEALKNIQFLRSQDRKKALLISATGTGKTYLSAFDVKSFRPKTFLFVVHRRTIAKKAMNTFRNLLGPEIKMGLYSGNHQEQNADYLFATVQTISKENHLSKFTRNHFDYIVIDETHRAGATSYEKILDYFNPKFLLGMTATPERTDGVDIFKLFDHNIAYEIRLHRAMQENMLSPFHYYGVTDLTINDEVVDDKTEFNLLTSKERIERITKTAKLYGTDDGVVRGLIFCSRIEECRCLSDEFNRRGYKTKALTGENSEEERSTAISQLESEDPKERLDYIFTVDIFNEGIDIPCVNQIIMLRPTQSAIIFVQQLGRGLRKTDEKSYLTVIDFIGNYTNNYLVPIALYGDTSYNKDSLRKLIKSGSRLIPGTSTINFDQISKDKIFQAIDSANMQLKKDLVKDYDLLKYKLGYIPMMMNFFESGSRDPQLYVNYSGSYFNFVADQEDEYKQKLTDIQKKLLSLFSQEINNSKRLEESFILHYLILNSTVKISFLEGMIFQNYGYKISKEIINSSLVNLNFSFIREPKERKLRPVQEIYNLNIVERKEENLILTADFKTHLQNKVFTKFLRDSTDYSIQIFNKLYSKEKFIKGFVLYRKYSRKDVFRILNWDQNPVGLNVGGYMVSGDDKDCAIFVNYHKEEGISETTKYEDEFLNPSEFQWMSKSNRNLNSREIKLIKNYKENGIRLPLFIKKNNDEGSEFYYIGEMQPILDTFQETELKNDKNSGVSVVKLVFKISPPVQDEIYEYLVSKN